MEESSDSEVYTSRSEPESVYDGCSSSYFLSEPVGEPQPSQLPVSPSISDSSAVSEGSDVEGFVVMSPNGCSSEGDHLESLSGSSVLEPSPDLYTTADSC